MSRLFGFLATLLIASASAAILLAAEAAPSPANVLRLEVFIRGDNELCRRAVEYVHEFSRQRSGIYVEVLDVQQDAAALRRFYDLAKRMGVQKANLPAFYTFDRLHIGFTDAKKSGANIEALFDIEAFVREGCPHCRDAKAFLAGLTKRWPGIRVRQFEVAKDAKAQQRMNELGKRFKKNVSTVPVLYVCGQLIVGFDSEATTGRKIEDLLRKGAASKAAVDSPLDRSVPQSKLQEPIPPLSAPNQDARFDRVGWWRDGPLWAGLAQGLMASTLCLAVTDEPTPSPENETAPSAAEVPPLAIPEVGGDISETYTPTEPSHPPSSIKVPGFDYYLDAEQLGLPLFTFIVGLLDGFNPCAMWVLVFLLSVLANIRSRARILAIAGTFVLISGLAYFTFMAAWMNVFLLIGLTRPIQMALGCLGVFIGAVNVKDFVAFKKGLSFSIPESAKPGIYARVRQIILAEYLMVAVGLAIVLALGVNMIELACTAGLPALYTEILIMQKLPTWQNYAYLLLYNVAYMIDDALLLTIFVITLSHRRLQEGEGRWLKLISGSVMLVLGLTLLFKPEWLHW